MKEMGRVRFVRTLIVVLLVAGISGAAFADSDCWCAEFIDHREDVPTAPVLYHASRSGITVLRVAASVGLMGLSYWSVDALGLPNAMWYKTGALVSGVSNIASAVTDLLLPTERSIERDEDAIAGSVLSEDLCADTLTGYATRTTTHRFVNSAIDIGSGLAQILLLSPYGQFATGEILDYVYLLTGGIELVTGVIKALFSTPFERDVRDARLECET